MQEAENELNIVLLDACRNNRFSRSFRSSSRGLAPVNAPKGIILATFSFIILLVMIWPMGSKPHGAEIVYICTIYSGLLLTEIYLIFEVRKRRP